MRLNLLVIRTDNLEALKQQYELLGCEFEHHQHGNGPFHYAAEDKDTGFVFEIYPLLQTMEKAESSLRLGFETANLDQLLLSMQESDWEILSGATQRPWGLTAVVRDRDGRKVELRQS